MQQIYHDRQENVLPFAYPKNTVMLREIECLAISTLWPHMHQKGNLGAETLSPKFRTSGEL